MNAEKAGSEESEPKHTWTYRDILHYRDETLLHQRNNEEQRRSGFATGDSDRTLYQNARAHRYVYNLIFQ
jgi:hypothetical protein